MHFDASHVSFAEKYRFQCSYCCKTFNRNFYKSRHEKSYCSVAKAANSQAAQSDTVDFVVDTFGDHTLSQVVVRPSDIHGKGCFSAQNIKVCYRFV